MTMLSKGLVAGITLWLAVAAIAEQVKIVAPAPAPVPEQVARGKTVFISNAGADRLGSLFSGGDDRPYNQFYVAMKSWGHYELTPTPAGSDLVFELRFANPPGDALLRLRILDPSTHVVLWALNVHIKQGTLQGTRDKNFDEAMASLVGALKELTARPVAGQ